MRRIAVAFIALSMLSACAWDRHKASQDEPQPDFFLMHVVLVWLKQAGNPQHREQIIEASQRLKAIPGVLDLHVGEVVRSDREVVEDSYDVALSLRFANRADLQAYLVHPLHVSTVKQEFLPIMQRYQVIDFAAGR